MNTQLQDLAFNFDVLVRKFVVFEALGSGLRVYVQDRWDRVEEYVAAGRVFCRADLNDTRSNGQKPINRLASMKAALRVL